MLLSLLLALNAAAASFPAPERSTAPITIVYPDEKAVLPPTNNEWIIGAVSDPNGHFEINGQTVAAHRNGAFLAWVPVAPGTFTFSASLTIGTTVSSFQREIFVIPPPIPLPANPLSLDKESLTPRQDEELRAGDWALTRAKASPGSKLDFRIGRTGDWQPMREVNPAMGLYEGAYLVTPTEEMPATPIEFRARSALETVQALSPGRVTISQATPLVATVRGQAAVMIKTGPGEGDLFPALGGTRLLVGGRKGNDVKLLLSNGQIGWIDGKSLEYLLPGAHPPRAETDTVSCKTSEGQTTVRIGLGDRVPFIIEESEDLSTLTVRFHYTYLHTNWVVYNSADELIDEIRLKQETSDIVAATIRLKPGRRLWGYWPTFEGNALKLELKRPPKIGRSLLAGIRVFIDPGHMPSAPGAIGPLGTKEMDINLTIAQSIERRLLKEGAVPLLSRSSPSDEVSLVERPRLAVEKKADIFVSVHNNFLSSGKHPFHGSGHGYSVFYYHPHSLELARAVFNAYNEQVPLPSEELRFGNLLVCRLSAMPAILTESAYLTYPYQEEMLLDPEFREKVAQATVDGLRAFLKNERERQK